MGNQESLNNKQNEKEINNTNNIQLYKKLNRTTYPMVLEYFHRQCYQTYPNYRHIPSHIIPLICNFGILWIVFEEALEECAKTTDTILVVKYIVNNIPYQSSNKDKKFLLFIIFLINIIKSYQIFLIV